ncbi:hypothetical protein AAXE64_06810 [Priestia megaterium]
MQNTINQLQENISKLQSLIDDMNKSRKQARIQEKLHNERTKLLCDSAISLINDKRTLNEILDDIEKSLVKRGEIA